MKLSAGKMGSIKAVKDTLKKGGSSSGSMTYIKNVPADGITVRFLTEPEEWFGYYEYFDADAKAFVPMAEGEVLPDGAKPSFRYLANALDVTTDRVIPLKLAKTAANVLILKYDKFDTMMDRNYELQKHGEGLDTTYDVTPDGPSKMNLAKYSLLDLESVLLAARAQATGEPIPEKDSFPPNALVDDDEDDDDEEPTPKARKSAPPRQVPKDDEVEYDYDTLYPNGEFRYDYSEAELRSMPLPELKDLAESWELEVRGASSSTIIVQIIDAQDNYGGDESDDDDEPTIVLDADDDDEADDADDDDEEVEYDEDALRAMNIRALRLIADDLGVEAPKGISKDDLIAAIIDAAEA